MNPEGYIAEHVRGLPRSGIRDFFAIVSEMPQAISWELGNPILLLPGKSVSPRSLPGKRKTSYTDNSWIAQSAAGNFHLCGKTFWSAYDPQSDVLVTVGVSEAIDIALRALLNPGDKVLYHEPCMYPMHQYFFGIRRSHTGSNQPRNSFTLDPDAFEQAWQPGCRF